MDFERDSVRPLSNYETYRVVKQIHDSNNERESGKRGKKGPNRSLEHCNIGLHTVTYETLKCLEQTPCVQQTPTIISQMCEKLKSFDLRKKEILQILNLRPTTPVELQLIIEDLETRLTDTQSNELIEIIKNHLPSTDAAEQ